MHLQLADLRAVVVAVAIDDAHKLRRGPEATETADDIDGLGGGGRAGVAHRVDGVARRVEELQGVVLQAIRTAAVGAAGERDVVDEDLLAEIDLRVEAAAELGERVGKACEDAIGDIARREVGPGGHPGTARVEVTHRCAERPVDRRRDIRECLELGELEEVARAVDARPRDVGVAGVEAGGGRSTRVAVRQPADRLRPDHAASRIE